ncbi:MAG: OmpH family outer membrane protein [Alphaproteobacteria bacterium]
MHRQQRAWMWLCGMLFAALLVPPASAQDNKEAGLPAAVIAVLDYQTVLREAAAAKDIRRQIEVYRKQYQTEIKAEEGKLRAEEADLKRQRTVLSAEAFAERRRAFEKKVIEVQKKVQVRTRALDGAFNTAMDELREVMVPIVTAMTKAQKFNIVIDSSQVMFASARLNITEEVIEQLDRRIKTVKVPAPKG